MKPTLLYLVRPGERNELLRYSLRSVAAHWPEARVVIAGHRPAWVSGVAEVPVRQQRVDRRNVIDLLRAGCAHEAVPERFVLMNDDFLALAEVEEEPPLLHSGTCDALLTRRSWQVGHYGKALKNTMDLLASWNRNEPWAYDRLHQPMPVMRDIMGEVLYRADTRTVLHRTLYGNMVAETAVAGTDAKLRKPNGTLPKRTWVSMSPRAWATAPGKLVRGLFPEPSHFEKV